MLKIPTPICRALERPVVSPRMPWTILEIPLRNSATAPRNIRITKLNIGNCIRIIENPIINKPIPILTRRDRPCRGFTIPISYPFNSNYKQYNRKDYNDRKNCGAYVEYYDQGKYHANASQYNLQHSEPWRSFL